MRTLGRHPHLADAMAAGDISPSWVKQLDRLTRPLPPELRAGTDQILLAAAAAGASLEDLTLLANAAVEQYLARHPGDDDGDGFDERFVQVQDHLRQGRLRAREPDPGMHRGGAGGAGVDGQAARPGRSLAPPGSGTTTRCRRRASCCSAPSWCRTGPAPTPR